MSVELCREAFEKVWKSEDLKKNLDGTYKFNVVENAYKSFYRGWHTALNLFGVNHEC